MSSRIVSVTFDHDSRTVVARVYLGTTTSGGDDRDDVISLNVEGLAYLNKGQQLMYEELAIEHAKGYR